MELAKEKRDNVQATLNLLMQQLKEMDLQIQSFSGAGDERKGVIMRDCVQASSWEAEIASKLGELRVKEKEIALKAKERQKLLEVKKYLLDQKSMELKSRERILAKREAKIRSELEEMIKEESELRLREKKLADLEEILDLKMMMLDMKKDSLSGPGTSSVPQMKVVERKRSRTAIELDSSGQEIGPQPQPQASSFRHKRSEIFQDSGSRRNVQESMDCDQNGLTFTITPSHKYTNRVTLPTAFVSAFDMSRKKQVILLSEAGTFCLDVKMYHCALGQCVVFKNGWRDFCQKNCLAEGMKCVFRLKEHTVNGDSLIFSMNVSFLGP